MTASSPRYLHRPGLGVLMLGGLLLAGCAGQPKTTTTPSTTSTTTAPASRATPAQTPAPRAATVKLPERTGIAACDDYLSSYIGCHRAAEIFAPGQLQDRYEAMRTSLLRDSQNPDIRPQLAARCNSLATQLRAALHGKPCQASPAPASSSP